MSEYTLISLYLDPRFTKLVRRDGEVVFEINTEHAVTTVRRAQFGHDKPGAVAGTIEWRRNSSPYISVGDGPLIKLEQFLRLPGKSVNSRVFTVPSSGTEYVWKSGSDTLKLTQQGSKDPVAKFYLERSHFFGKDELAHMVITGEGLGILDTLIVSWVYMARQLHAQKSGDMFANTETEWTIAGGTA